MIEKVYAMGDDALTNLFDIMIGPIPFLSELLPTFLRIQSLSIPETGITTYEYHHKTQKVTKAGGKIEVANVFDFTFRVDRYWSVYRGFSTWKNFVAHSYTGYIGLDSSLIEPRVDITVMPLGGANPVGLETARSAIEGEIDLTKKPNVSPAELFIPMAQRWRFIGCFVQKLGEIPFDMTSGEPITCTVTMGFAALDDSLLGSVFGSII